MNSTQHFPFHRNTHCSHNAIQAVMLLISLVCLATLDDVVNAEESWSAPPERVEKLSKRGGDFNYIEADVPEFSLPDPLIAQDGQPVTSAEAWQQTRRSELMELFRNEVYGRRPDVKYQIRYEQTDQVDNAFDGLATGRGMKATISIGEREFSFPFTLFIPNQRQQPAPAIVHINNRYLITLEKACSENDPFWPARTIVEQGFATASFHTSDVDPDRRDGYAQGVRSFFADGASPEPNAWRSLSAWGWAASRIVDHLESLDAVDGSRVAVVGHSRGGKTALWAACEDERFAIAYSNNSGCGGAALSRRRYGETVGRITASFPHWFCPPFAEYADREHELPVDQHEVIALIAPRAVYVTSADEDLWADPRGEYQSLVEAAPVFELLGERSIRDAAMPPINQPRVQGKTGYHIRTGGHGLGEQDWTWFLDFANTILKPQG